MKKIFILTTLLCFTALSAIADKVTTLYSEPGTTTMLSRTVVPEVDSNGNLTGRLLTEKEYFYNAAGQKQWELDGTILYEYTYNEAGQCTKRQTYSWVEATKYYNKGNYETYEYDADGNMSKRTIMKIPYGKTEYVEDDVFQNYVYENGIAKSWDNYYNGILFYNYRNVVSVEGNTTTITTQQFDPDEPGAGWKTLNTIVDEYSDGVVVKEKESTVGKSGTTIVERTLEYADYKSAFAPANLKGQSSASNVSLSWDAVEGATKYVVTYEQNKKEVTEPSAELVIGEGERRFAVQAVIDGKARNASFIGVTVGMDQSIMPVTNLTVGTITKTTETTESIEAPTRDFFNIPLTWTLPEGHGEVLKYNIYYDSQRYGKAYSVSETNPAVTSYMLKIDVDEMASKDANGVPCTGVLSDIYVTAVYATGESEKSNIVQVNPFKELGLETGVKNLSAASTKSIVRKYIDSGKVVVEKKGKKYGIDAVELK